MLSKRLMAGIRTGAYCLLGLLLASCRALAEGDLLPSLQMAGGDWPEAVTTHTFRPVDGSAAELWSISSVYARHDVAPALDATDSRIFALASLTRNQEVSVHAFDGRSGKLLWSRGPGQWTVLAEEQSLLFVGGVGDVRALDAATGELRWSVNLSPARSVTELALGEAFINVNTVHQHFFRVAQLNGQILGDWKYDEYSEVFFEHDGIAYVQPTRLDQLAGIDRDKGTILWQVELGEPYYYGPAITDDSLYIRSGRSIGPIYRISREGGLLVWRSHDETYISDFAVEGALGFGLNSAGELHRFDLDTGEATVVGRFSPSPLIRQDEDGHPRGYHVAFDREHGLVFAQLGDSWQLFAIRVDLQGQLSP